jgi:hypothetical protein
MNPSDTENQFQVAKPIARAMGALATSDQQRAIAEVQAALMIARANPRDEIRAMDNILNAFTRPTLAEQSQYQYSKGGSDVSGPSIRSAEAIAQLWGNMQFGFRELSRGVSADGVGYSEIEAFAWDVQSNTKRPTQFRVPHWRDKKNGGYQIKEEREIYELCANMAQRRVRACILAVIPGDVIEQAMRQADATLVAKINITPELITSLVDAFDKFGVSKAQIEKRIQRHMEAIVPAQVASLKKIQVSLRDGMSSPEDWFDVIEGDAGNGKAQAGAEKPAYSQADFDKNIANWKKLIASGKKTAEQIVAMANSKAPLTAEQIAAIKNTSAPGADGSAQAGNGGAGAAAQNPEPTGEMTQAEIDAARAKEIAEAAGG